MRLAAESGPAGVTMSAVAAAVGAPSGSMYHRFAGRPALLAEVWLEAAMHFQESGTSPRSATRAPSPERVAATGRRRWTGPTRRTRRSWVTAPRTSAQRTRPDAATARLAAGNRHTARAIRALARRLGATDTPDVDRVTAVVLDLPYGLVQRHLRSGQIPRHAADLVEGARGHSRSPPLRWSDCASPCSVMSTGQTHFSRLLSRVESGEDGH